MSCSGFSGNYRQSTWNSAKRHTFMLAHILSVHLHRDRPVCPEGGALLVVQADHAAPPRWLAALGEHLPEGAQGAYRPHPAEREEIQPGVEAGARARIYRPRAQVGPRRGVGNNRQEQMRDRGCALAFQRERRVPVGTL